MDNIVVPCFFWLIFLLSTDFTCQTAADNGQNQQTGYIQWINCCH